ncbi:dephospho-CoA kinase [Kangiella marina]|uniref:Dephospho-CoA kinase n=1 Tax=Kangiella marina TaxID=1079178 RepID=A0ABP8IN20_9GAMM
MTYHIVLTGGVASGKSAVSQYFEQLGVTVIDADIVARDVVTVGSEGLSRITEKFGVAVLHTDGTLNRQALRDIVFSNDEHRNWLNQLLHPMIRDRMSTLRQDAEQRSEDYTLNVIPLYLETIHGTSEAKHYQRVLLVDVDGPTQLHRLMQRDESSEEQAKAIINSQASRDKRVAVADDIITNSSDLQSLKQQVINLDKQYRELARS